LIYTMMKVSHAHDAVSQNLVNRYMCTEICPCLKYESANGDTQQIYSMDSNLLSRNNRTFDINDKTKTLMIFTEDKSKGYKNFDSCYDKWKKYLDPKMKMPDNGD